MEDQVISPGSCKIHSAIITNSSGRYLNVTNITFQVNLYEDLMSPFITGSMTISDAASFNTLLPLTGEEILTLDIETPYLTARGEPLARMTKVFYIYKLGDRVNLNTKNTMYTLYFMSIEGFIDANTRISQTFRGRVSDTVRKLIEKAPGIATSKKSVIETTANSEIHTSNFWSPIQNIYYLLDRALNDLNNPSYVFFENNEGFVFMSLDTLMAAPAMHSLVRHQKMRDAIGSMNLDEEYTKILDMNIPTQYDYIDRLQHGYYGGKIYHYDIQNKVLNVKNLIAKDDIKKNKLNPYINMGQGQQFLPEANLAFTPEANQYTTVIHKELFNGSPGVSIDHDLRRMALLKQVQGTTINVQVYGKLDYSVGRVVEFTSYMDAPTDKGATDTEVIDPILTGRYLITAISHEITTSGHLCTLELSKDSNITFIR